MHCGFYRSLLRIDFRFIQYRNQQQSFSEVGYKLVKLSAEATTTELPEK